jgi:hypothetical protein
MDDQNVNGNKKRTRLRLFIINMKTNVIMKG